MEKVIITGGAGFIGSHLTEELIKRGYSVTIVDDLSTGKQENIDGNGADFIRGTITDLSLLQKSFQDTRYVFHQAAIPSVPRSIDDPQLSHEVNITGTLNVLLAARDNGVKKIIYASSSSVYGDIETLPKREDMTTSPLSPYAVAKLTGERYCRVFEQVYGLPTVCLRYFNIYGPRQDPDPEYAAVVPRFIKKVSEGNSPIIFGDGKQTRDLTFVKDAVEANIRAAESNASGIFNISRGERVSINHLVKLIIEMIGNPVDPIYQDSRPGDVKHSLADISKAKAFGYQQKYDLSDGLTETAKFFNTG